MKKRSQLLLGVVSLFFIFPSNKANSARPLLAKLNHKSYPPPTFKMNSITVDRAYLKEHIIKIISKNSQETKENTEDSTFLNNKSLIVKGSTEKDISNEIIGLLTLGIKSLIFMPGQSPSEFNYIGQSLDYENFNLNNLEIFQDHFYAVVLILSDVETFANGISKNQTIKSLTIVRHVFENDAWQGLVEGISKNTIITSLNFSSNNLTADQTLLLIEKLPHQIQELDLSYNYISKEGLSKLNNRSFSKIIIGRDYKYGVNNDTFPEYDHFIVS